MFVTVVNTLKEYTGIPFVQCIAALLQCSHPSKLKVLDDSRIPWK